MRKFFCLLIVFLVCCQAAADAAVVNNTRIPVRNELHDLARTVSPSGSVGLVLMQGVPYHTGVYYSKLSPYNIRECYNNYFAQMGIEGRLNQSSQQSLTNVHLAWRGCIQGKDNVINVVNDKKTGISMILIASEMNKVRYRSQYNPIIECFPELRNFGGTLAYKNEFVEGARYNGVYVYTMSSNPEQALRNARAKFINAGWQDPYGQVFSPGKDEYMSMLSNSTAGATLVCHREGPETKMVITINAY